MIQTEINKTGSLQGKTLSRLGVVMAWVLSLWISGCAGGAYYVAPENDGWEQVPYPADSELVYRVFLIGDTGGASSVGSEPALNMLRDMLSSADSNSAVVFLGDNIYCCGLPDSSSELRSLAEMRIGEIIRTVEDFPGRIVVIPGNHDWGKDENGGLEVLARQERYLEDRLGGRNVFLPDNGFPGPVEVELIEGFTLVALDTEWWLTSYEKSYGDAGSYDIEEDGDFLIRMHDLIVDRRKDDLLVVGHHPLRSNGNHGGKFSVTDHLFPLTKVVDNAYIPLPVVGSLYPLFRHFLGGPQDLAHWKYQSLRDQLDAIFRLHEGRLVYASGHEHSLQYFDEGKTQHIISGSGARSSWVAAGSGVGFTYSGEGLITIDRMSDGAMWMTAWGVDDQQSPRLLFRRQITEPLPKTQPDDPISIDSTFELDTENPVHIAVNPSLAAGGLRRFFMGDDHRDAWTTEVALPVFDIGNEKGGLRPLKRGGNIQTASIRLVNDEGDEFVLRAVVKDPTKSLPSNLRGTVATEVIRDQVAILHPFGALIVPPMVAAAGIYHTLPKLFYVPRDPRFGVFEDMVAGKVMLFEERPNDDMSHADHYGNSDDVVSARKMYARITDDNDHSIDQALFARARLFDMFTADWDRHADQFRWATFDDEVTGGKIHFPIPRDRDWAFSQMNGLFPSIVKSRYFVKKFQDFRDDYGFLEGLNEFGMSQDRRLTAALTQEDWIREAEHIRSAITDEVIDEALSLWPDPIQDLYRSTYETRLRIRRDKLPEVAGEYYRLLSRLVDVVGSRKHERFEVTYRDDGLVDVVVYKTSKKGEIRRKIYSRTFDPAETMEIRLYGLDGNDRYYVNPSGRGKIELIMVAGPGNDRLEVGAGARGRIRYIDSSPGEGIFANDDVDVMLTNVPLENHYDRKEYGYNTAIPQVFFGSNRDDGLFLGGGVKFNRYAFRKKPYSSSNRIVANYAIGTDAFNVLYGGHFVDAFAKSDLVVNAEVRSPNNIRNFYGLGNETGNDAGEPEFYQARLAEVNVGVLARYEIVSGASFSVGPSLEVTDVRRDTTRFNNEPQEGLAPESFENQWFATVQARFDFDFTDSVVYPRHGFRWNSSFKFFKSVAIQSSDYATVKSDLVTFFSSVAPAKTTYAVRIGFAHNIGLFPFYGASTLGGRRNLRGWRSTRFAGRTSFYQNAEVRIRLLEYMTLVATGSAGLLLFIDNGRVWTDGESSSVWHQGYGGGVFINFLDMTVLQTTVGISTEEVTVTLGMGFQF